ncbi:hypothetical protein FHN55_20775 [Streptomyces sp. NP160]|uniref:hypothetical protein n=1 Tax=Streptomyces sp. NP160 TaxID=2586637 RepID=UPI0011191BFB|nr:hypothetical protein [Streptomyces sp. NP160]TNM59466.1 hypothetical protein FHN55_20775 [Streptomyces sp. NP160]
MKTLARKTLAHTLRQNNATVLAWYLSAGFIFIVANLAILLLLRFVPPEDIRQATGGLAPPDRAFQQQLWFLWVVAAIAWLFSQNLKASNGQRSPTSDSYQLYRAGIAVAAIGVASYLAWAGIAITRGYSPGLLLSVLQGNPAALAASREYLRPVAGITSVVAFSVPGICAAIASRQPISRWGRWLIAITLAGAVARTFLNAERLALEEFMLPVLVAIAFRDREKVSQRIRSVLVIAPFFTVLLFAAGEALRPSYTSRSGEVGFTSYIYDRLLGYYLSAQVNGEPYARLIPHVPAPNFTADAIWNAPLIGSFVTPASTFGFDSRERFAIALGRYLNPELNTVALLPSILAEWGIWLAVPVVLLCTIGLTVASKRCSPDHPASAAAYGFLLIAALESARYPYLAQSRFWLAILGCLIVIAISRRIKATGA